MMNKVLLIGNLGSDPELRILSNGNKVASFSLATSETFKKDGIKTTNTEWHNITFFTPLAEIAEKYIKKGSKIHLEGKIKYESYEKDGVKKYTTKIIGSSLIMLDNKGSGEDSKEVVQQPQESTIESDLEIDGLPF